MIKGIKSFFDENQKLLKQYNSNLDKTKKIASKIEEEGNNNEKEIKEIVKNNISKFKEKFKGLNYQIEKDNEKIKNIFKNNKEDILANIYVITKYIPEWKYIPFDTQLIAILSILDGKLIEMKTGEGKSLVSFLAGYIKSLAGYTVNVISINEYLISRDVKDFETFAKYLDFEIGLITSNLNDEEKQKEYNKNIVYSTQDIIFDYLKDNMSIKPEKIMIKDYYFSIIDEIDVILIDLATTPIMLSIPENVNILDYIEYKVLADEISKNKEFYKIDLEAKHVELTNDGVKELEKMLNIDNIYGTEYFKYIEGIQNALKAELIFKLNEYYIIKEKDKRIIPIDHVTGRPIEGKMFPSGIQQSIETKEFGKPLTKETKILANISYQNFFKLFSDFSGLSGTLETEKDEFYSVFGKEIISIPRFKEENVEELNDLMFKDKKSKIKFLTKYIKEINETGQPLLIGTPNSDIAEEVFKELENNNIKSNILTANHIEEEAKIIEKAGSVGEITIITNMSGRGTDIKITEEANKLGGLFVIGFERGDVRRIDNQLKGRVGRQGNNGKVLFLFSPEDKFISASGKQEDMINLISNYFKNKDDEPIQMNGMVINALLGLQRKIEERNTKGRGYTLGYDRSLSEHRKIFYKKRNNILETKEIDKLIDIILELFENYTISTIHLENKEESKIKIHNIFLDKYEYIDETQKYEFINYFKNEIKKYLKYINDKKITNNEEFKELLRILILTSYDYNWTHHLSKMSELKSQLIFVGQTGKDPLVEYNHKAFGLFENFLNNSEKNIFETIRNLIQNDNVLNTKDDFKNILNELFDDEKQQLHFKPIEKKKLIYFWKNILEKGFFDFTKDLEKK